MIYKVPFGQSDAKRLRILPHFLKGVVTAWRTLQVFQLTHTANSLWQHALHTLLLSFRIMLGDGQKMLASQQLQAQRRMCHTKQDGKM